MAHARRRYLSVFLWLRAYAERRRVLLLLSSMSDRELKDIGLVRSHIDTIVRFSKR